jgi:hypothetical protein
VPRAHRVEGDGLAALGHEALDPAIQDVRTALQLGQRHVGDPHAGLSGDEHRQARFRDRRDRVAARLAIGHRHAVHEVHASSRHTILLGMGGRDQGAPEAKLAPQGLDLEAGPASELAVHLLVDQCRVDSADETGGALQPDDRLRGTRSPRSRVDGQARASARDSGGFIGQRHQEDLLAGAKEVDRGVGGTGQVVRHDAHTCG